eukprot:8526422-Pyramimonas_sp.AAC.1
MFRSADAASLEVEGGAAVSAPTCKPNAPPVAGRFINDDDGDDDDDDDDDDDNDDDDDDDDDDH